MRILYYMPILTVIAMTVTAQNFFESIFEATTVKMYTAQLSRSPAPKTAVPSTCITDDNQNGYCVDMIMCKNKNIVIYGTGLKPRLQSDSCPQSQVCCVLKTSIITPHVTTISPKIIFPTPSSVLPTITKTKVCGYRGEIGSRSSGGYNAEFGEFPWVVPIFKIEEGREVFVCGGSLIHPRLVLTYASRFTRGGSFVAKPGDYDIKGNYERVGDQTIDVTKLIPHKDFNSGGMYNNIAILVLKEAVRIDPTVINNNIGYACLPTENVRPTPGTKCIVTGWGSDKMNGSLHSIPKMLEVPMVDFDVCQALAREHVTPQYRLHSSIMCFGGIQNEDTCRGDGGSPLVCLYPGEKNRYYQAGIVSWGPYCGKKDMPSFYTDVAALRPWIDETVRAEGFDTNYYTP